MKVTVNHIDHDTATTFTFECDEYDPSSSDMVEFVKKFKDELSQVKK